MLGQHTESIEEHREENQLHATEHVGNFRGGRLPFSSASQITFFQRRRVLGPSDGFAYLRRSRNHVPQHLYRRKQAVSGIARRCAGLIYFHLKVSNRLIRTSFGWKG